MQYTRGGAPLREHLLTLFTNMDFKAAGYKVSGFQAIKNGNTKVFPHKSCFMGPYVGIIQIRFMGRSSQLPLSLSISSPVYGNQYKIWKGICQQEICGLPVRRICLSVTCPRFTVGRYLLRTLAPLVAITSLYQSKDFFLFLLNVPLP